MSNQLVKRLLRFLKSLFAEPKLKLVKESRRANTYRAKRGNTKL